MAQIGFAFLVVAFAAACVSAIGLGAGQLQKGSSRVLGNVGRAGVCLTFAALLACCAILVACFMGGDVSILYVLKERSLSTDSLAWLYKLSGLWAGREGSLLFWTFLIALFNMVILGRFVRERTAGYYAHVKRNPRAVFNQADSDAAAHLDDLAMTVASVVVAAFCGVLLFSDGNMPFVATPASYFAEDGSLTAAASANSMNQLLEHWAMAIHPPMLFVGYAGLTVPFAYAVAAIIANDASELWVVRSQRFVLASWLFLGAGIGLGALWAYVVLGWGGYWGWDPVENASLLPWLVCVALVHTFTVYRQRGAFKRWALMCACLAFTFVIVATFVTRSGIVQSVHAFAGDPVSLALFGSLIAVSLVVGIGGVIWRWKTFAADVEGADDVENMLSKDAAYYFNNVIMMVFALLLTYMTLTSALPSWLPFGGDSLGTTAYEAIARPLGIVYLFILAACPLLAWGKTDRAKFLRQARVPAACALVLFALLAFWWATQLVPAYDAMMAKADANAETLLEAGPGWYYNGLALVGLLVASLLLFNAAFMFVRNIRVPKKRGAAIGGAFAHTAMAIILVGLIGSSMYVYEESGYMASSASEAPSAADDAADGAEAEPASDDSTTPAADGQPAEGRSYEPFEVREYRLEYASDSITDNTETSNSVLYEVTFDVYKDGSFIGQASPSVQLDTTTQLQKLNAAVLGFPEEDLFVVYRGVNQEGAFSLDVRVNPLISLVWVGFAMLMAGTFVALVMSRRPVRVGVGGGSAQKLALDTEEKDGDERRSLRSAPSDTHPAGVRVEGGGQESGPSQRFACGGECCDAPDGAVLVGGGIDERS